MQIDIAYIRFIHMNKVKKLFVIAVNKTSKFLIFAGSLINLLDSIASASF
jgi:hypothetical protein